MIDVLMMLGKAYAAYRAAEDSGIWLWRLSSTQTGNYVESFLITKGLMPTD